MRFKTSATLVLMLVALLAAPALQSRRAVAQQDGFPLVELPEGYRIEKVVDGLTYPTSVVWDDEGQMYVVEAGGQFLEEPPPARILRIEDGKASEIVDLTARGVADSVVGATWHDGAFYVTHRDARDRTGAVSRVTPGGELTQLFSGIVDAQSEHNLDEIRLGPDGRMYVAAGGATNSAVVGLDNAPFVERSPDLHATACRDIVLTGQNFETPDFRTEDPDDTTLTGAFVPFGTQTEPGQEIAGSAKCGSSILAFDPADPDGTLEMYAWGFRHVIGFAWNSDDEMFASVNSYDVRGSRPVEDEAEATYRVREGAWYGWPDYSAALEPLTDAKFDVPDSLQAPVYVGDERQDKDLGFLIDHGASGLEAPDPSLVLGLHEYQSSPTKLDVAPDSWGDLAGHVFVAEWGDLAPETNPLQDELPGYRVVRIDPERGQVEPFVSNAQPGPASEQDAQGEGIERPFDVKFGPDGAMYVVDYGVARVNQARAAEGQVPYEFPPETGALWKVTPTADERGTPTTGNDEIGAGVVTVDLSGHDFVPTTLEIPAGTTVTWTNSDPVPHSATADSGEFDSGTLVPGERFSQTFDMPGTVPFYCIFHAGSMRGHHRRSVVVLSDGTHAGPEAGAEPAYYNAGNAVGATRRCGMAVEDFLDSHVAVAIAGTAVVLSPRAPAGAAAGAIYGVAGALMAGDTVATFARGVADGSRQGTASLASAAPDVPNQVVVGESDAGS